ncbi:PREDICTED: prominin-1-A-like isoform X2 [Priapulus caudatus]|uniref:Prominin-1-A-like isoform X2 n=1 Tax=Priapulus caudatus TaxID=37621 RepID=A0ABM1E0C9_PRICU|nr:PREDICTED: prominin-1-A-like isoform X2 [Priapulus caudatus]
MAFLIRCVPMGLTLLYVVLLGCVVGKVEPDAGVATTTQQPDSESAPQPNLTSVYKSKPTFNPKGMEFLYQATNFFLDVLVLNREFPDLTKNGTEFMPSSLYDSDSLYYKQVRNYETGFIVCFVVGCIYVVAMFFTALVFLLCRCCGGCGAQQSKMDDRFAKCKRVTMAVFLFLVTMLMLFGVICTFVTNEYVDKAVLAISSKLRTSLQDVDMYLTRTDDEVKPLFTSDYELYVRGPVHNDLDDATDLLLVEMTALTGLDAAWASLAEIQTQVALAQADLITLSEETRRLRHLAGNLSETLESFQETVEDAPLRCVPCIQLKQQALSFHMGPQFQRLPDVSAVLENVTSTIEANVDKLKTDGRKHYIKVTEEIQARASATTQEAKNKVDSVGRDVAEISDMVSESIRKIKVEVRKAKGGVNTLDGYIQERPYAYYYTGVGISAVLLLIVLLNALGLMYGVCAPRPNDRHDDSCTRSTGSNLLMAGVALSFLFCWIIMIVCVVLFIIGGNVHILVCDPLASPTGLHTQESNEQIIDYYFTEYGKEPIYGRKDVPVTFEGIITRCNNNQSFYEVFRIDYVHNITEMTSRFKAENEVSKALDQLDAYDFDTTAVEVMPHSTKLELRRLVELWRTILEFDQYRDELSKSVLLSESTSVDTFLNSVHSVGSDTQDEEINLTLEMIAEHIGKLQRGVVKDITDVMRSINVTLEKLVADSTLTEKVESFIEQVETVERKVKTEGPQIVRQVVTSWAEGILGHFERYLVYVEEQVAHKVGACEPVSKAFNASVFSVCKETLYPLNGFWAGLGICMIMVIPSIILSVKLAGLYRKTQSYTAIDERIDKHNRNAAHHHYYDNSSDYYDGYSEHHSRRSSPGRRPPLAATAHNSSSHHGNRYYNDRDEDASTVWEYQPYHGSAEPEYAELNRPPPYNSSANNFNSVSVRVGYGAKVMSCKRD